MTPNQEHELYLYLVTLAAHNSHKELEYCLLAVKDLVRRCERRAEEAAWEARGKTRIECGSLYEFNNIDEWRKLREEPKS